MEGKGCSGAFGEEERRRCCFVVRYGEAGSLPGYGTQTDPYVSAVVRSRRRLRRLGVLPLTVSKGCTSAFLFQPKVKSQHCRRLRHERSPATAPTRVKKQNPPRFRSGSYARILCFASTQFSKDCKLSVVFFQNGEQLHLEVEAKRKLESGPTTAIFLF